MKAAFRRLVASVLERQVRRLIARHRLRVVAVAGSVGKTSARAAIVTVLSEKFRVQNIALAHPGYNSEIGLPLSVFGFTAPRFIINPFPWLWLVLRSERIIHSQYPFEMLVLELGTDHPGELKRYISYLKPDIGVMTAVTPEHMENFPGGLDQVAEEELTLARASGVMVINSDAVPEKYRRRYLQHHRRVLTYSIKHQSDAPESRHLLGHMRWPALAAVTVARELGLSASQIAAGLEKVTPVAGRMNPLPGTESSTIIDDSYNSSPDAVVAALDTLANMPGEGRRFAILGSMNELGPGSPQYHRQAGTAAAGVDWLVTIGHDANTYLGPAAVHAGLDPTRWRPADSPYAAAEFVRPMLQKGDLVLVKGSQDGVYAEEAVKLLLAHASDAAKLVRQTPGWLRTKAKQFPGN